MIKVLVAIAGGMLLGAALIYAWVVWYFKDVWR